MGNPAGVRRDFQELEQRRLEAAELLRQGLHQAEVARRVGVHRQSVSRWAEELRQGGKRALRKAGRAGRRPRLRPEDLRRIEKGLKRGPQALGYETSLWTSWRVAHLIERECGVKYHPVQAWRILRQLGWSCQRPVGRALERDEDKIRQWKQQRWPEIKKKPRKRAAPSSSSTKAD
jgi:transposase